MKKLRIGSLVLAVLLLTALLGACGGGTSSTAGSAAPAPDSGGDTASAGSETAATGDKTVITFWNGFTGPDREVLEKLVAEYNSTNDKNVEVVLDIMPWDSLYQKLSTVLSVGEGPDILAFATERIGTYAKPGALAEIGDIYEQGIVDASVIPPALNEYLQYDGKYYGVPMNFATLLLYYNKTIFEEAGLDPEAPPTNWDELEAYALQIAENTDKYGFGMATSETTPMWPIMLWGNGGDIVQDGKSVLNSPENVETIERWASLIRDDEIGPPTSTGGEIDKLFESQKLAMYFCGPWATGGFENAGIDFGVAQAPEGPVAQITQGNGVGMYMTSSSQNKEAVYDFFGWWNSADTQIEWSLGTGFPLARTDVMDDPRLAENPYIAEFSKASSNCEFYLQGLTNFAEIDAQAMVPAYEEILLTGADVQTTLDTYSAVIDELLQK